LCENQSRFSDWRRVAKFLNKLGQKERKIIKEEIRIIYRIDENKEVFLLSIERKNDNTYKFLNWK